MFLPDRMSYRLLMSGKFCESYNIIYVIAFTMGYSPNIIKMTF